MRRLLVLLKTWLVNSKWFSMGKIRPIIVFKCPPGALLQLLSPLGGGSVVVCQICSVCLWGFCVLVL